MAEPTGVVSVRLAVADDAAAISSLVRSLSSRHIDPELSPEGVERLRRSQSTEAIRGFLDQAYRYHLATENDELVGVAGTRGESHLFHLFVADSHQRRGIARRLWAEARMAMRENGGAGPYTVNASRSAVAAYARLGFVAQAAEQERAGIVFTPMTWTAP